MHPITTLLSILCLLVGGCTAREEEPPTAAGSTASGQRGSKTSSGSGGESTDPEAQPRKEGDPTVRILTESSDPRKMAGGRIGVLLFITTDCPIANGYAPQIHKLAAGFAKQSVDLHLVHVDPDLTVAKAQTHARDYGHGGSILLDQKHELVAWAGATITPEAVVYDAAGTIHYRGRINNWYGDIGRKRMNVSKHELRDAVDAVLAGRQVLVARAPAVGCTIEPLRP